MLFSVAMTRTHRKRDSSRRASTLSSREQQAMGGSTRPHPSSVSDVELLELLLRISSPTGAPVSTFARYILGVCGGIGGLGAFVELRLHEQLSADLHGVENDEREQSSRTCDQPFREQMYALATAVELGRRAFRELSGGFQVNSYRDVQRWANNRLAGLEYEEVWVLPLRTNQRTIAEWCVGRGGVHGCGLLPADILRPVLRCAAGAFILVHNHPSGDPRPSRDDVAMTEALHRASLAVGVTLIDHVIVSRGGAYSLAEARLCEGFEERGAAE